MKAFLLETCRLWYWAVFRPETLRQHINASTPQVEWDGPRWRPGRVNILFSRPNHRLLGQFTLLTDLPLLPLCLAILAKGASIDWLFVPAAALSAYGLGVFFRSLGLHIPLLMLLLYLILSDDLRRSLEEALSLLPSRDKAALGMGTNTLGLLFTGAVSFWLLRRGLRSWGNTVLIVGVPVSTALAISVSTKNLLLAALFGGAVGFLLVFFRSTLVSRSGRASKNRVLRFLRSALMAGSDNDIANTLQIIGFGIAFSIVGGSISIAMGKPESKEASEITLPALAVVIAVFASGGFAYGVADGVGDIIKGGLKRTIATGVAGGIAFGLACGFVSGMTAAIIQLARLPLPLFLLAGWFIGWALAPAQGRWPGLIAAGVLAGLGLERADWGALWVIPATLLGYYRLLPEYLLFALVSSSQTLLIKRGHRGDPLQALHMLPPYTSELLWLPLPGHDELLAAAFRDYPTEGFEALQQMRTARLPGFRHTIRQALPQIAADQLLAVKTPTDIVAVVALQHPLLPLLAPTLYQEIEPNNEPATPATTPPAQDRIALVLPRLRAITHDIGATLSTGISFALPPAQDEIVQVLPRIRAIARDIEIALGASSPFLRERGLEECLTQLERLQSQLPGLGLEADAIPRWREVLEHWQTIIQATIEQETLAQGEVINPFQSGNPLREDRPHLFKGRQSFADAIVRQVLERGRPTLVLYGPRRCGKSSFLLNLSRLLPSTILPVYLDLQNPAVTANTPDFCFSLARAIARGIKLPDVRIETPRRSDFATNPYAALEDWLDQALTPLEGRRILLCLDEFEKLSVAISQGRLDRSLFDALRHLIQHRDELSFLFCGVQTLDELGPNWSSYFISVRPIEMTYLEEDEARAVLEDPDQRFNLCYADGVVERALKATNRQPYLLQLVGEEMVKQANQHRTRTMTELLLAGALEAALAAGEPYFSNIWTECTGTNAEEILAGRALLRALACGQPLVLDGALTQAVLRRLVRYHVLARTEDGYCFEVPLIARWIRERTAVA